MSVKRIIRCSIFVLLALGVAACEAEITDNSKAIVDTLRQTAAQAELTGDYNSAVTHYKNLYARNPVDTELRLALARNLRYTGAAKGAIELLQSGKPDSRYEMAQKIELGKAMLAAGHTETAIHILKEAEIKNPKNWEIYSALGVAYDMAENFVASRTAYETAMGLSDNNPAILNNFALSVALNGDLDGAIEMLKNAPRMARHTAQIRQNLAMFYGIKGDLESAQALGRMDLDEETVQKNLLIYSQLGRQ